MKSGCKATTKKEFDTVKQLFAMDLKASQIEKITGRSIKKINMKGQYV